MPSKSLVRMAGILRWLSVALALLVVGEGLSFLGLRVLALRARASPIPSRNLPAYRDRPWADSFWREQRLALSYEAHPSGLWRSRPFAGETIVVDAEGIRRTVHSRCQGHAPTVYVFGGSTVWGYGSPDWETIPSHLARRFAEEGQPACVVNFGEDSWRSDQGLIKLIQELKRPGARRPDRVVFLNGCNDVFTPFFLTGRVDREWEFEQSKGWLNELLKIRQGSLKYLTLTNTVTLARRIATRLKKPTAWPSPQDPDRLALEIVENHLANMRVVDGLSRSYGFRYSFFWQPMSIAGAKVLTAAENEGTIQQLGPSLDLARTAVNKTLPLVHAAEGENFHDLAGAFDGTRESVYLDSCHLLPEGNRMLADTIYPFLE
jgi:lysophospholipase L1-like esterase